jgi:hypothetical protein
VFRLADKSVWGGASGKGRLAKDKEMQTPFHSRRLDICVVEGHTEEPGRVAPGGCAAGKHKYAVGKSIACSCETGRERCGGHRWDSAVCPRLLAYRRARQRKSVSLRSVSLWFSPETDGPQSFFLVRISESEPRFSPETDGPQSFFLVRIDR